MSAGCFFAGHIAVGHILFPWQSLTLAALRLSQGAFEEPGLTVQENETSSL
jgi:hypothetical protein